MAENERRGFAGMNQEKQKEIARKGGKAAHEKGTAHEFTPEEAREAGRKGGEAVSRDREHMSRIGREGGLSSRGGQGRGSSSARNRARQNATTVSDDATGSGEERAEENGGAGGFV